MCSRPRADKQGRGEPGFEPHPLPHILQCFPELSLCMGLVLLVWIFRELFIQWFRQWNRMFTSFQKGWLLHQSCRIPHPTLFSLINKAHSSHMGKKPGNHLQDETSWSLGPSLGWWVAVVMSGKQLSFAVALCPSSRWPFQWYLPDLRFWKTKGCHWNHSHESSNSRFVL